MTAPAGSRWQRDPQVLWRRLGDELVVLPPGGAECLAVSGVSALLWELLVDPVTADDLAERLAAEMGAEGRSMRPPVETGLRVLADAGLLRRVGSVDG